MLWFWHFSSLILKISIFTLAICCLTTSNLSWFMDITFQVPMLYCCLQHQTLLLSPITSRTGCCFCFSSVSSSFQELFMHWSAVAYWEPTWGVHHSVSYLFAFSSVHGVLKARILKWLAIPPSSGPYSVRTLHHVPSILGGPTQHGS